MRLGALGGPETFAGQAAVSFASLGPIRYFPSAREEWAGLTNGEIDAFVMLAESSRTGFGELAVRAALPTFGFYVAAEAQVPYRCLLLGAPGSQLAGIRSILGHGSVSQCRPWLAEHLPAATVAPEDTSSLAAAEKVARGDGTLALVGTAATATSFHLNVLARDIDAGVTGNYWLVTREPRFSAHPTIVLTSARYNAAPCGPPAQAGDRYPTKIPSRIAGGQLGLAISAFAAAGYQLRSLLGVPTGNHLFEYDYLLAFTGQGDLTSVQRVKMRLVGAFSDIIAGQDGNRS